ncbi:MAG: hypothetical protein ABIP75_13755 [Pyrinomonadaceae bacterium]
MEKAAKNKWFVRGVAVMVFVLGFAAGALALNVYRSWSRDRNGSPDRQARFELMMDRLQLNEDQKIKTRETLAETRVKLQALRKESEPRVAEIRKQADARLQTIMNADQWQQFQKMRDEDRNRGRRNARPER